MLLIETLTLTIATVLAPRGPGAFRSLLRRLMNIPWLAVAALALVTGAAARAWRNSLMHAGDFSPNAAIGALVSVATVVVAPRSAGVL